MLFGNVNFINKLTNKSLKYNLNIKDINKKEFFVFFYLTFLIIILGIYPNILISKLECFLITYKIKCFI
jgi:NADH:ubiquinone oxidoreductase subunit 4 (subunit M)